MNNHPSYLKRGGGQKNKFTRTSYNADHIENGSGGQTIQEIGCLDEDADENGDSDNKFGGNMLVSKQNIRQRRLQSAKPRNARKGKSLENTTEKRKEDASNKNKHQPDDAGEEKIPMPNKLFQQSSEEGDDDDYEQILLDENMAMAPTMGIGYQDDGQDDEEDNTDGEQRTVAMIVQSNTDLFNRTRL